MTMVPMAAMMMNAKMNFMALLFCCRRRIIAERTTFTLRAATWNGMEACP